MEKKTAAMWKCPRCGREFKKIEQGHYCGDKPENIDEYILSQDEDKREELELVRKTLQKALPEADEKISWSMPTYWKQHNIIHFAAFKKHIGLYPGSEAVAQFKDELEAAGYKTDKGTIRFPYGKVNTEMIARIAKWCWETEHHA